MKLERIARTILPTLFALSLGCADEYASHDNADAHPAAAPASTVALTIERAERLLARGGDAAQAKALLAQALADPAISAEERSLAILVSSRAHAALGEAEAAVSLLEQEMAAHAGDRNWADRDFHRQLRQLLTGSDESDVEASGGHGKVPAFARVLSRYFPVADDGKVTVMTHVLGGDRSVSDELGTFNVVGAIYAELEATCPLCDRQLAVTQGMWRGDWTDIPAAAASFENRLLIIYYDLGSQRVPARYERYLPMPVAAIEAELGEGKSFAVAKERPGAPPVLLLAAPRGAMLADLERELALRSALPIEPFFVDVSRKLRPQEIQGVVRGHWFGDARSCYESLLKRSPRASGKIRLDFAIEADGKVSGAEVVSDDAPFQEETFRSCLLDSLARLRFPAAGSGKTTVGYPLVLTPDDEP